MSAMLTEGMLSKARASPSVACFSLPCTAIVRSLSIAPGSAAITGALIMKAMAADTSSVAGIRIVIASARMSRSPSALAGERRELVPHPMMTLVAVIARMPEQPHRN
jgi:hypothetical protein